MPSPSGEMLRNGFPTTITFSLNNTISLWEVEVGLPGPDGGEAIDVTTMRNVTFRTKDPRKLQEIKTSPIKVGYDPQALSAITAMINRNQQITYTFPTGGSWTHWGYLRSFMPEPNTRDENFPIANCIIEATMHNNSGAEAGFTVGTSTTSTTTT